MPTITTLRRTWPRHDERHESWGSALGAPPILRVRLKATRELPRAAEGIESPYDTEARYRHTRETRWTGDMVHVSETCEPAAPH